MNERILERLAPEARARVEQAVKDARTNMEDRGDLAPVALIYPKTGPMQVIALDFENDAVKSRSLSTVAMLAAITAAPLFIVIAEAWRVLHDRATPLPESIENHPDREEVVQFIVAAEMEHFGGQARILRAEGMPTTFGRVEWLEMENTNASHGTFPLAGDGLVH